MVAATDLQGRKAPFTQESAKVFWAPGTDLTFQIGNRIETRSGTTYAASIAAGVAARVLGDNTLELPRLLKILRSTSLGTPPNPLVVNLDRALATLKSE